MFSFNNSLFGDKNIPPSAKIVFVADMFVDDYVGGAELTTEALITSSPFEVHKLHSKDVTLELLKQGVDKFWIFGNFAELNPQLIPSIIANIRYSVVEYDYKYCKARSPEKHKSLSNSDCDCAAQMNGKIVSTFFHGAMGLWWMSDKQRDHYLQTFPFLASGNNVTLSSVFNTQTISRIKQLRSLKNDREGWIVLGSKSWIKGVDDAETWCKQNNKKYEVVWNEPYDKVLEKLSKAEGFVYMPKGMDTCPRMVIEAKLLGCKLEINENVQHNDETWFATDDIDSIEDYLLTSPKTFWSGIKTMMDYKPSISGYTTTLNCVSQGYPFEQCIQSMLEFCEEICVVDGGSTDGTWEKLTALASNFNRIKLKQVVRDWNHPRFAVFDGMQKAEARSMCTKEFCWQMDSDEIVHEADSSRILELARAMPKDSLIISLPVVEYWGGSDKVRMDVTPWKWRLSRNDVNITHGIPGDMRIIDTAATDEFNFYAREGTDGCDMIFKNSLQRVPFVTFYTDEIDNLRKVALLGNDQAKAQYQAWMNSVVQGLPGVYHYSWYDLHRKIRLYRNYWTKHWVALKGDKYVDDAQSNMMFDKPWSEVTDSDIDSLVVKLKQIGGWIWHRKWNNQQTPWMTINKSEPKIMKDFYENNKR